MGASIPKIVIRTEVGDITGHQVASSKWNFSFNNNSFSLTGPYGPTGEVEILSKDGQTLVAEKEGELYKAEIFTYNSSSWGSVSTKHVLHFNIRQMTASFTETVEYDS
ncbi:F-box protein [Acrasis kona]|uniref:F-box protein n=1 Tax=Acrasis kona TaxID=1008807 RepID=A0AAW2ZIA4_9EUKA